MSFWATTLPSASSRRTESFSGRAARLLTCSSMGRTLPRWTSGWLRSATNSTSDQGWVHRDWPQRPRGQADDVERGVAGLEGAGEIAVGGEGRRSVLSLRSTTKTVPRRIADRRQPNGVFRLGNDNAVGAEAVHAEPDGRIGRVEDGGGAAAPPVVEILGDGRGFVENHREVQRLAWAAARK